MTRKYFWTMMLIASGLAVAGMALVSHNYTAVAGSIGGTLEFAGFFVVVWAFGMAINVAVKNRLSRLERRLMRIRQLRAEHDRRLAEHRYFN